MLAVEGHQLHHMYARCLRDLCNERGLETKGPGTDAPENNKPEIIEGQLAWLKAHIDAGEVHLFGFRPHYRSWSHGTFNLIFRSILLGDKQHRN